MSDQRNHHKQQGAGDQQQPVSSNDRIRNPIKPATSNAISKSRRAAKVTSSRRTLRPTKSLSTTKL
jgi:hypothetical protein